MKKGDIVLIAALLLSGCALFLPALGQAPGSRVTMYASGQAVYTCELTGNHAYTWRDGDQYVSIEVADGKAWVADSSCPDLDCVHRGSISKSGQSIICLPNRISIEITGGAEEELPDAVLY